MRKIKNNWSDQLRKLPIHKSLKVKTMNQRQAVMDAARELGMKCVSRKMSRGYQITKFPEGSTVCGKTGPKFRGGERKTSGGMFVARITAKGKPLYLGSFRTKEEADKARDAARKLHHAHYFQGVN